MTRILGGGILNRALAVVGSQTIGYIKFTGRTTNTAGQDVATYAAPVAIKAQVQAVPHSQFSYMGLDFNKNYIRIYSSSFLNDLQRNVEADRFSYCGAVYEVMSNEDWKVPQGYIGLIAVRIT